MNLTLDEQISPPPTTTTTLTFLIPDGLAAGKKEERKVLFSRENGGGKEMRESEVGRFIILKRRRGKERKERERIGAFAIMYDTTLPYLVHFPKLVCPTGIKQLFSFLVFSALK